MIRKQRQLFYFVGEQAYASLDDAQKADLIAIMESSTLPDKGFNRCDLVADWLLKNKDAIVDTLTTTPKSRLRARKLHGGTKARKPKKSPEEAVPA